MDIDWSDANPSNTKDSSHNAPITETTATLATLPPDSTDNSEEKSKELDPEKVKPFVTKVCGICAEDVDICRGFPMRKDLPPYCRHARDSCKDCIGKSLNSDVETKRFLKIGCPYCECDWGRSFLANFMSEEAIHLYDRTLQESDPKFRSCLAKDCDGGYIYSGRRCKVSCHQCHSSMCFNCRVPWHEGKTCQMYQDELRIQDELWITEEQIREHINVDEGETKEVTRVCPKCKCTIFRSSGCDHIRCKSRYALRSTTTLCADSL